MNQLEKTIIENAKQEAKAVLHFYKQKNEGTATADDADDYLRHYHAMNALLMIAHQVNGGMSAEGVLALLAIEQQHAAVFSKSDT